MGVCGWLWGSGDECHCGGRHHADLSGVTGGRAAPGLGEYDEHGGFVCGHARGCVGLSSALGWVGRVDLAAGGGECDRGNSRRYAVTGHAFGGFKRNISSKAVCNHNIDRTLGKIRALDKAVIIQIEAGLAQQPIGLAHLVMAFFVFRADIQDPDGWTLHTMHGAVKRLAHDRKFDQLRGIANHIGPDIQHGRDALGIGPAGDNGGPLHIG